MGSSCEQLIEAVNKAMEPAASQEERQKAYTICETFKENSPKLVPFGVELSLLKHPPIIRHFGLQLLEHSIKFRWNKMSPDEKVYLKNIIMEFLQKGVHPILKEEIFIKDGLAKLVVEMIKREYPQNWPNMLQELHNLCKLGDTQTELVMLVLLRLVEDVVTFQSIPQTRRKEITQAMSAHMDEILSLLVELLRLYSDKYKKENFEGLKEMASASVRVAETILMTLAAFVEFIQSQHLFGDNNAILILLYLLLSVPALRLRTAECLVLIVNRKGKLEERKPLLILLSEDALTAILNSAREVSDATDETSYVFLKLLCQVLCGLTYQLHSIWTPEDASFKKPDNLSQCLTTLLAFTSHPSVYVSHLTLCQWKELLRHPLISEDPAMDLVLPDLLKTLTRTMQKVGLPSRTDSPSCHYSAMDFDSDEEFIQFLAPHRCHQVEVVRMIAAHSPAMAFMVAADWLKALLLTPLQFEEGYTHCTHYSPSWYQWDALQSFMDSVMVKVLGSDDHLNDQALQLLHCALHADIQDPLILSCVLTCVSALFPSLKRDPQQVGKVIEKLFAAAVYSVSGQTKKTRTRPVQKVRHHACCALVRMCLDHPQLMVPFFDQIHAKVRSLIQDPDQLTKLERVNLNETLILISNEFQNFAKQSALIEEVLEPVSSIWIGQTTKNMIFPAEAFLHHVGLDAFPTSPSQEEALGANRAHITTCLTHILAVMKRSGCPKDMQAAINGGFVSYNSDGQEVMLNPCAPHILPMLEHVLLLCMTLNAIWTPPIQAKVCPEYKQAFEIPAIEKNNILGTHTIPADMYDLPANRPMAEKTQTFLQTIHDHCCHILASACQNIGAEFYNSPGLLEHLVSSVFHNVEYLPNFKLRTVIRVALKSLVQFCPQEQYKTLLVPLLSKFCLFMLHRLSQEWETVSQKLATSSEVEGENSESQEILADYLIRMISRDYLELIKLCLKKKQVGHTVERMEASIEEDQESKGIMYRADSDEIGELGECILADWELMQTIVFTVYSAISWSDSPVCLKAIQLTQCLLPKVMKQPDRPLSSEGAVQLFTAVLRGFTIHGQNEACKAGLVTKGLWHYEEMRPTYPNIQRVLYDVPGNKPADVDTFTKKYIPEGGTASKPFLEKKRKFFKQLIEGLIPEPLSTQHRIKVDIRDLPPLYKPPKMKVGALQDTSVSKEDLGMVALFADTGD